MAENEELKILRGLWASDPTADRNDPEDFGIDRAEGFGIAYEQVGGAEPEREVFNQKFREWDGFYGPRIVSGGCPEWDPRVNYDVTEDWSSFVLGSDGYLHVAIVPTGPRRGNVTNPTTPGQGAWRRY